MKKIRHYKPHPMMTRGEAQEMAHKINREHDFKSPGLYWHYHHSGLLRLADNSDAQYRLWEIADVKPLHEVRIRLQRFRKAKRVPRALAELVRDYFKHRSLWRDQGDHAHWTDMCAAQSMVHNWIMNNQKAIKAWHAKECKKCPYNHSTSELFPA